MIIFNRDPVLQVGHFSDNQIPNTWPGHNNQHAGDLSRILTHYELFHVLFHYPNAIWGPHTMDHFASLLMAQLQRCNSIFYDPLPPVSTTVGCVPHPHQPMGHSPRNCTMVAKPTMVSSTQSPRLSGATLHLSNVPRTFINSIQPATGTAEIPEVETVWLAHLRQLKLSERGSFPAAQQVVSFNWANSTLTLYDKCYFLSLLFATLQLFSFGRLFLYAGLHFYLVGI